jgi:23S rRNA pseudouridine1911/1915/1917 synthase
VESSKPPEQEELLDSDSPPSTDPPKFKHIKLKITEDMNGLRLDKILGGVAEIQSRSQAAKLLQSGWVRRAGKKLKPSYLVLFGDEIDIDIPIEESTELQPYDFPVEVVYEDSELIVVNKPAGLVVHPAYGHKQDTLVNALIHYTKDLAMGFGANRPGLVHRIDKDTSGLLVIAKNEAAHRFLANQFQKKTTHRVYYAVVYGDLTESSGTYQSFLRRHPEDRKKMASTPNSEEGKLAITHYESLKYHTNGLSLVRLKLETGRTHQIRMHLSEAGHPVVGDMTYGSERRPKNIKSVALRNLVSEMKRFILHACELGFVHPTTKQQMNFWVDWPSDVTPIISALDFALPSPTYDEKV